MDSPTATDCNAPAAALRNPGRRPPAAFQKPISRAAR